MGDKNKDWWARARVRGLRLGQINPTTPDLIHASGPESPDVFHRFPRVMNPKDPVEDAQLLYYLSRLRAMRHPTAKFPDPKLGLLPTNTEPIVSFNPDKTINEEESAILQQKRAILRALAIISRKNQEQDNE